VNNAAAFIVGATQTLNALTINSGTAQIPAGANKVLKTSALTIDAGTLDVADNALVIDYTAPIGALMGTVRSYLAAGKLFSSGQTTTKRLGYIDNATAGLSSFSGQPVDPTSILLKLTTAGDADFDGDTDGVDIGTWAVNFTGELGGTGTMTWAQGDWDYDGDVDGVDAGLWATAFTGELGGGGAGLNTTPPSAIGAPRSSRGATPVRIALI